ncbi:MAG: hypothetical protein VXZ84_02580 [Planctomycetota bacterium]|nr:hypothetical protein [Planctomycetota bacterium]
MANVISHRAVSQLRVWGNNARVSCASILLLLSTSPLFAFDAETIRQAIDALSSDSFSVRTRAEKQLLQIGSPAESALIAALDDADPETRGSARRILQHILTARLEAQIRLFSKAGPEAVTPPLPGWTFYREHVGDDAQAQASFIDAVLAEPVLLESLSQDNNYSSQALLSRTQTLYDKLIRNPGRSPGGSQGPGTSGVTSIGSVMALLIVAANNATDLDEQTAQKLFQLMNYSGLTQNLITDANEISRQNRPHRRLVGHFVRRSAGTSLAYQMLWLSMQYNLTEGLVPAELIIREKAPQPYVLQNAMLAIAKLGDKEHSSMLAPYLSNEQPVNNRRGNGFQPLVRDVALATTIHLHGQNPKDFGFTHIRTNRQTLFQAGSMGFSNAKQREAAFNRWKAWKAAQSSEDRKTTRAAANQG